MKQFRVSAKNLANLNMPNSCLRCFWTLLQLRHKTPFNIFPGIFSTFDSNQKQLIEKCIETTGKFPSWMGGLARAKGLADTPPRMEYTHSSTNIVLTGVPDHVFEWPNELVSPVDYKTARYSKGQDALKPLYEAQLDIYALLLDVQCSRSAEHGALVYFEPKEAEATVLTDDGFTQPWKTTIVNVDVSGEKALELLDLARDIYEQDHAPDGRAECPDCDLLAKVFALAKREKFTDSARLRYMTPTERARHIATADYKRTLLADRMLKFSEPSKCDVAPSLVLGWDWDS